MNQEILNRAKSQIDVNDFSRLVKLHREHSWLLYEPEALFELWCLSENDEQKILIEFLIKNFSFIEGSRLSDGCKEISHHIEIKWNLKPQNTYLLATCDDNKPDGSQSLIQNLKNKFSVNWKESNFYNSIVSGANEIPDNSNLILVDDFIGTGDTITKRLNYINKVITTRGLSNITIMIITFAAMNFSAEILNNIGLEYYSVLWLKKGISELAPDDYIEIANKAMEELENKLKKDYHGKQLPKFGYKRSESLFALGSNNIPNNVFPIFWWPFLKGGIPRRTIFRRV